MTFSILTSKLTGIPGTSGWAQIHEFKPEDTEKLKLRGHLIAAIATKRQEEGRELITRLQEEYFGKEETSAFNALKNAVQRLIEEAGPSLDEIEIVAAAIVGDVVYTAVGGGGKVTILRDGMLATILEGKIGGVACASGYPKDGDILILGTTSFFENIPNEVVKAGLGTGSPEAAVEYFAPMVHSKEDSASIGMAIVSFKKEEASFIEPEKAKPSLTRPSISAILGRLVKSLPERKIYVHLPEGTEDEVKNGRKVMLSIGITLLVLLVVSIGFGIKAKKERENKSRYAAALTEAEHELSEAEGLFTLNPDRSRELLAASRDKVNELLARKISDPQLTALQKKIEEDEGKILGEYREEPEIFIDLSLLSSGFTGDMLSASGGKIYVLDKKGKKIVGVTFSTKRSEVVAGPDEVENALFLAAYEDRVFVLRDTGVFEVTVGKKKVVDKDWSGEVWLYAYTGNLYLLDKSVGTIWRYQGGGENFGSKQRWLGPGVTPDFSKAVSWVIDGSVWVLNNSGRILKFTLGKQDALVPSGIAPSLDSATAIYTNENLKYVYILQAKKGRVVVLSKDGNFKAQYLSDQIVKATGLVVSESEKKIVLLLGNKLYSIEIRHF